MKDYIVQFKLAILEIYNLDESVAMLAMKRGLRSSRFIYSLDKTYLKSYSKLLIHAQKYIHAKEATSKKLMESQRGRKLEKIQATTKLTSVTPLTSKAQS